MDTLQPSHGACPLAGFCPEYARLLKAVCEALYMRNLAEEFANTLGTEDFARIVEAQRVAQSSLAKTLMLWGAA